MPRLFPAVQRAAVVGTAATAFVLAGCSDSTSSPSRVSAPDAASLSQSPDIMDQTGRHVFHTKQWFENDARQNPGDARPGGGGGGGNTGIYYHGGPVLLAATNVVAVYWASGAPIFNNGPTPGTVGDGSTDRSLVGYFLNNLGGSSYFNINSTYNDGAGHAIANVVNYTRFWANSTNAPSGSQNVSDAQMLAMLESGFNTPGVLTYDPNTLYAIFTSGAVNLGGGFGTQYCAYHYHGTVTVGGVSKTVLYAAMPYNYEYPSACTAGAAPNGDPGADAEVNTLAHEVEETTTDLLGNAWFDRRGYENADKCAWNFGTRSFSGGQANIQVGAKYFLVQQNWLNTGSGGCAQGY